MRESDGFDSLAVYMDGPVVILQFKPLDSETHSLCITQACAAKLIKDLQMLKLNPKPHTTELLIEQRIGKSLLASYLIDTGENLPPGPAPELDFIDNLNDVIGDELHAA